MFILLFNSLNSSLDMNLKSVTNKNKLKIYDYCHNVAYILHRDNNQFVLIYSIIINNVNVEIRRYILLYTCKAQARPEREEFINDVAKCCFVIATVYVKGYTRP